MSFYFSSFPGSRFRAGAPVEADEAAEVGQTAAEDRQIFSIRRHDPDPVDAPVHVGRTLVRVHLVRDRRERTPFAREELGPR